MLNITQGVIFKPQKVVIYGPAGIGKTTFASKFPDPLFIDTEGSTKQIDVKRLVPSSWSMLIGMIQEIKRTPNICKTLVVDTVDWAELMCINFICDTHKLKSIESPGYGKGYTYVKEEIGKFLNLLSDLTEVSGINVLLTAHSTIKKFELPDECGSYDRYELKLSSKAGSQTAALVKEWADMLLFINYKQIVVETDNKKKVQGGSRVMYTQFHPCWDAKNRHDLKAELPFEYDQISYCIPNHVDSTTKPIEPTASPEVPKVPEVEPTIEPNSDLAELPKSLKDLMSVNNVTIEEIQQAVSARGYYPKDTPITNYADDFINGVLVGAWDKVFEMIKSNRELPIN